MIRKLMTATAISLLATSGVLAAETAATTGADAAAPAIYMQATDDTELASKMIGETVYTNQSKEESLGDINDLVVKEDGSVEAVIIGVGGFLGIGEKNVAVNFDKLEWATDESGNQFAVFPASRDDLTNAPEFKPKETAMAPAAGVDPVTGGAMAPAVTDPLAPADQNAMAPAPDATTEAPADTAMAPAPDATTAEAPADTAMAPAPAEPTGSINTDQAGGAAAAVDLTNSVSASDLIGATVYGADDQSLGDVGDVRLSPEGAVDAVIVDVGGFLGIGEKPVALAFESLKFKQDENGALYVYSTFTKDELNSAPAYDKAQYDDQRDTMRLSLR